MKKQSHKLFFAAAAVLLLAAACGGGDEEADTSTTTTSTSAPPTTPATIPETTTTIDPLWLPINASQLAPLEISEGDFAVADTFSRCDIYAPEQLTRLLERKFKLSFAQPGYDPRTIYDPGFSGSSGACTWDASPSSEAAASVVLRLAALPPAVINGEERADPAMGDSAAVIGDIWRDYCHWADPVWEMLSSTDGPGVAFRVGNIIAQTNVVPSDETSPLDQQTAELVLAQNISRRLANANFTPCEP